jgi:hypothetical protein
MLGLIFLVSIRRRLMLCCQYIVKIVLVTYDTRHESQLRRRRLFGRRRRFLVHAICFSFVFSEVYLMYCFFDFAIFLSATLEVYV